jgi:hypothetical protein
MGERTLTALVLALVLAAVLAIQVARPLLRRRRRAHLQRVPLPRAWRQIVHRHVAFYSDMPPDLRQRLDGLIQVFLDEKRFVGCAGLAINDTIRIVIAAHACALLVNRPGGCFDAVQTVLVYPDAFYVDHEQVDESGVVHRDRHLLSGESWEEGQVVVSWDDALDDVAHPGDGQNVVIHEFAHQLDGESGSVNGAPVIEDARLLARWGRTMREEFDALNRALERDEHTLIDPYGATEPAEFFAVVSEHFFEMPGALRDEHPQLYRRMREFYRIDPAQWPGERHGRHT